MRKVVIKDIEGIDMKSVLKTLVSLPPKGGSMNLEDVRRGVKLLDMLDAAKDVVLLEDADWRFLRAKVEGAPYSVADKRILEIADAVIGAPEIGVTEA